MCHSDDSRPPLPPISGAAADQGDLELTAADGNRFGAFAARAQRPTGAGIVILPDVRGLHNFYKELAVRFAEAGHDAVTFDYYGRTAGVGTRDEAFEYRPHVERTSPQTVAADVRACVEYLRSADGGAGRALFAVGFCFGGGHAWRQAAEGHGLSGAIGFYGDPARVMDVAENVRCPILMLVAGADFRPVEAFRQAQDRLSAAGKAVEVHIYDGAPHSFFDRTFEEHRQASADAWRRTLDFISRNSQVRAPA